MKILLMVTGKGWGGIESQGIILASAFQKWGYSFFLACTENGEVQKKAKELELPLFNLRITNSGDILSLYRMIQFIKKEKIELVIANIGKEYWPATLAVKITGCKIIFIRHQLDRLRPSTCRLIKNHVQKIVAVSGAVKEILLEIGIPEKKIEIIHNTLDLNIFNPGLYNPAEIRKELGIPIHALVVGTAGKLHPGKGIFELLKGMEPIFKKYPDAFLLFAGDGPAREDLEEEINRLSLRDKVRITGRRSDLQRIYAAMDIFILPSTCKEAFGMVMIEAMAMKKPVIGTTMGGIPEVIQEGINGFLIPPGNPEAITKTIFKCIEDKPLAEKLAIAGRQSVEQNFSESALKRNFEKLLKEL